MHMLRVHNEGIVECGYEMAKAKTTQVIAFAREHLHRFNALTSASGKYWSSEGCFFALLRSGRPPSLLG
jgi:hypothetical protein